jgi:hypothetical protein
LAKQQAVSLLTKQAEGAVSLLTKQAEAAACNPNLGVWYVLVLTTRGWYPIQVLSRTAALVVAGVLVNKGYAARVACRAQFHLLYTLLNLQGTLGVTLHFHRLYAYYTVPECLTFTQLLSDKTAIMQLPFNQHMVAAFAVQPEAIWYVD